MLNLHSVGPIVTKKWLLEVDDSSLPVPETLWHWCQTVPTLVHQSDGAEMSLVRSVLGLKCLDTDSDIAK